MRKLKIAGLWVGATIILLTLAVIGIAYSYNASAKDYKKVFLNTPTEAQHEQRQENGCSTSNKGEPNSELSEGEIKKDDILNIVFLGIDRSEERDETMKVFRSDTIALASFHVETGQMRILCIPRDTYTFIPIENKKDKINHAYAYGSKKGKAVEASLDAINHFLKYDTIDYYFALDMEPIPDIVDDMGGVAMDVELDMKTHGANLSKGIQDLNGEKAFDYIHWRYGKDGDIGRIKRQQKFFKAIYAKMKSTGQIINSIKLILNYHQYIQTDLSLKQMIALSALTKDVTPGTAKYQLVPGKGETINRISYWVPDKKKTDEMLRAFFLE